MDKKENLLIVEIETLADGTYRFYDEIFTREQMFWNTFWLLQKSRNLKDDELYKVYDEIDSFLTFKKTNNE